MPARYPAEGGARGSCRSKGAVNPICWAADPQHAGRQIPNMRKITKRRDKSHGYLLKFAKLASTILPAMVDDQLTSLSLHVSPRNLGQMGIRNAAIPIRLRGKAQRAKLLALCDIEDRKRRPLYRLPREFALRLDRFGEWYLHVLYHVDVAPQHKGDLSLPASPVVLGCDPGVRTPWCIYSSAGIMVDIGQPQDAKRIEEVLSRKDALITALQSRRSKKNRRKAAKRTAKNTIPPRRVKGADRQVLKKQLRNQCQQQRQLVDDVHCRAAHFMAAHADVIVMPRMEVQAMVSRRRHTLRPQTKRLLLAWRHADFLDRLTVKCHDIGFDTRFPAKGATTLLVQPEGYASKTCGACGACGVLKEDLGSNKTFSCAACGYRAGRDHNAARNMVTKALRIV